MMAQFIVALIFWLTFIIFYTVDTSFLYLVCAISLLMICMMMLEEKNTLAEKKEFTVFFVFINIGLLSNNNLAIAVACFLHLVFMALEKSRGGKN